MRKLYLCVFVLMIVVVFEVLWMRWHRNSLLSENKLDVSLRRQIDTNADIDVATGHENANNAHFTSGDANNVIPDKILPQRIVNILNARRKSVLAGLVSELKAGDKEVLLDIYKKTNLIDRKNIIWALAIMGGDGVYEAFNYSLTKEFSGQKIGMGDNENAVDEEMILFETVRALGFVANTSDSAYEFCKSGTDPWFWKNACEWTSNRGADTVGMLTAYSITAVGISGQEDSINVIETLKNNDVVNRTDESSVGGRNYASSIVDAAFFIDRIHNVGYEKAKSEYLNGYYEQFLAWSNTENGKKWREWYNVKTKP